MKREPEPYGNLALSIQASQSHYCEPRMNLPNLTDYEAVEVAVLKNGRIVRPETVGLTEFADLFERCSKPVAGWVPQATVQAMREKLATIAIRLAEYENSKEEEEER